MNFDQKFFDMGGKCLPQIGPQVEAVISTQTGTQYFVGLNNCKTKVSGFVRDSGEFP